MRKPKREDVDECRTFIRVCAMLVSVFVVWGLLYMPLKSMNHVPIPEHLTWMVSQKDLPLYIRPENDTDVILPRRNNCSNDVFIAVIVCSAVPNFDARNVIRQTWANDVKVLKSIRVFFLVGISSNDSLNTAIAQEADANDDIIQQDFIDTYNNLTLKSVMLLKWVCNHCPRARYIMKSDDDMFVHLPNLFRLLKAKGRRSLLVGCLIKGAVPVKDWNSKWFVPDAAFPERVYPNYLSGTGYVLSQDTVPLLYRVALSTPFFYLEDIFITGVCASRAGLKPVNNDGFKFYKRRNDICIFRSLITAHKMSPKELVKVWSNIRNPSPKCKKS